MLPLTPSSIFFIDIIMVGILGLALGSFSSVLAYREARGLSWYSLYGRSACPHCKTQLRAADLVPLFSWLFLRGRCRSCRKPVPMRYPLLELASMALCLLAYIVMGAQPAAFILIAAVPFLLALTLIDLEKMILPDRLMAALTGLGLIRLGFRAVEEGGGAILHYGIAALVYGIFAWLLGWVTALVLKKEALGMGDVKFFALAGLWLGFTALPAFCVISGLAGIAVAFAWRMRSGKGAFPFGPALIVSFYVMVVFGEYHFW